LLSDTVYSMRHYSIFWKQCVYVAAYTIHCCRCLCAGLACTLVDYNKTNIKMHGTCIKTLPYCL